MVMSGYCRRRCHGRDRQSTDILAISVENGEASAARAHATSIVIMQSFYYSSSAFIKRW